MTQAIKPKSGGEAFALAAIIGAFGGMAIAISLMLLFGPAIGSNWSEWWALPAIAAGYGALALPFVAMSLAIFGLPVAAVLKSHANRWWIGVIAVIWGAIAGKLTWYGFVTSFFLSAHYTLWGVDRYDLGLVLGVTTAVAYWRLQRGFLSRASDDVAMPDKPHT